MSNPHYPQHMGPPNGPYPQQHMGPGMAPPMGALPRPVRRGTSKAVPVVVSAGLAIGVFCGLLFGVGTDKEVAAAAPAKGNNIKPDVEDVRKLEASAAPQGLGATPPAPTPAPPPPAPPPAPEIKKVKLTIEVKPESAAKQAKITVDGTQIEGNSIELPADQKTVVVEIKADGFRSAEKKIELLGGDMAVDVEMAKKPSGGGVRPPKRPDRPPSGGNGGGGGLIDI